MSQKKPKNIFMRIIATIFALVVLILGLMFSMVILIVVAALGVVALGFFYWKTRAIRKAMRERGVAGSWSDTIYGADEAAPVGDRQKSYKASEDDIIEGEVVNVSTSQMPSNMTSVLTR